MRLGFALIVRLLRAHPSLGKNIAHGTGQGLKLFPWAGGFQVDDIIKDEMPFIESIVGPGKLNRAAPVLFEQFRYVRSLL